MKSDKDSVMYKIAEFIVDKRKGFFVLFIVAMIFCLFSIKKVGVEDDVAKYLPQTTETRQGVDLMDEEFTTFGTAKILIANITYDRARDVAKGLENIDGINTVKFYDPDDDDYKNEDLTDYYKDSAALYTLMFDEEKDTELSQKAIAEVRDYVKDYDSYVYTTVDLDESADLQKDISFILCLAAIVIIVVLLFTSETYAEVPIFVANFAMAAILNKGTNFVFGTVSFISNAVDTVLQLALAIDYAIILFHRYMEEKDKGYDAREALIQALSKAIVEISSSSLTTIAGLAALIFMHFQIGKDMGLVLCKAILFSLVTVFLFMPFLIMAARKFIEKTRHRSFVPEIKYWGKFVYATRFILPVLFLVVLVFAVRFSNACPYIFDKNSASSAKTTEYLKAKHRIDQTFETGSTMAAVLPKGSYAVEKEVVEDLEKLDYVGDITGLANVKVGDNDEYVLTDELNPREFAEVADIDVGISKLLYTAYAYDKEAYGAFVDGIDEYRVSVIDMIDFVYEKNDKGTFNLSAKQSEDINDIHDQISDAREQLESDEHTRIIFTLEGPVEGKETFAHVDEIRNIVQSHYKDRVYVVGDPTSNQDLSASFSQDNTLISILTALFVGIILLFTFQSASIPFILLITIQGSIWINFSVPYLTGNSFYFLCYLIASSIQMGATIDYAIVITNRYLVLRKDAESKREAAVASLNQSFATILTSGTILTACGFLVWYFTSNAVISQLGMALGRGTVISMLLVMMVLPQLLILLDPLIDRTAFTITHTVGTGEILSKSEGTMTINGTVKGYFSGYIDGQIIGNINGEMNLTLKSGSASEADDGTGAVGDV